MSTTYPYDIAAVTPNQRINPDVLAQQLIDAAYASGGTFEGLSVEGGVADPGGVINAAVVAATAFATWQNALDAADEAAQDALVAAHQGDPFGPNVQRTSSEGVDSTGLNTPQTKVSATALPLPAGDYLVGAYCEIKLDAAVALSGVRAAVLLDANEVAVDNWDVDQWHAFSAQGIVTLKAGETPTMSITYHRIGAANNVDIRRARISISQQ